MSYCLPCPCHSIIHTLPASSSHPQISLSHWTQGNLFNTLQNHLSLLRSDKSKAEVAAVAIHDKSNKRTASLISIFCVAVLKSTGDVNSRGSCCAYMPAEVLMLL